MAVSGAKVRISVDSRDYAFPCEQAELAMESLDAFFADELWLVQGHEGRNH